MKAWALRDTESGLYLPWGKHNRQNSWQEFDSKDRPRLFTSKRAAVSTVVAWRQGGWRTTGSTSYYGEYDYYLEPKHIEGRDSRKIAIVEFDLTEQKIDEVAIGKIVRSMHKSAEVLVGDGAIRVWDKQIIVG